MKALLAACKPLILLDLYRSFNDTRTIKSNDFTLEIVGFFLFAGWPHLVLTTILTTMRAVLSGQSQGKQAFWTQHHLLRYASQRWCQRFEKLARDNSCRSVQFSGRKRLAEQLDRTLPNKNRDCAEVFLKFMFNYTNFIKIERSCNKLALKALL